MGGQYNFKFAPMVKELQTKYGNDFNIIMPFTPIVPLDSDYLYSLPSSLAVSGGDLSEPVGVTLDSTNATCMDPLNVNLHVSYITPVMGMNKDILNTATSSFWLNRNIPYLTGNNLTDAADPFAKLPYYPGNKSPSDNSLPE